MASGQLWRQGRPSGPGGRPHTFPLPETFLCTPVTPGTPVGSAPSQVWVRNCVPVGESDRGHTGPSIRSVLGRAQGQAVLTAQEGGTTGRFPLFFLSGSKERMSPPDAWRLPLTGCLGGSLGSAESTPHILRSEAQAGSPWGPLGPPERAEGRPVGKTWCLAVVLFLVAIREVCRSEGPPSQAPGRGARAGGGTRAQGLGPPGSCAAYRARVWCRNWYCSAVWIMPPLWAQHAGVSPPAALTPPGSLPPPHLSAPHPFLLPSGRPPLGAPCPFLTQDRAWGLCRGDAPCWPMVESNPSAAGAEQAQTPQARPGTFLGAKASSPQ